MQAAAVTPPLRSSAVEPALAPMMHWGMWLKERKEKKKTYNRFQNSTHLCENGTTNEANVNFQCIKIVLRKNGVGFLFCYFLQ